MIKQLFILLMLVGTAAAYVSYDVSANSDAYNCPDKGGAIGGCGTTLTATYGGACTDIGTFDVNMATGENVILHAYFSPDTLDSELANYQIGIVGDDILGPSGELNYPDVLDMFAYGTFAENGQNTIASSGGEVTSRATAFYKQVELPMLKAATAGWNYHICLFGQPRTISDILHAPDWTIYKHAADGAYWTENIYTGKYTSTAGTLALAASFNPEDAPHWTPLASYSFTTTDESWTAPTHVCAGSEAYGWTSEHSGALSSYCSDASTTGDLVLKSPNITVSSTDYIKVKADWSSDLTKSIHGAGDSHYKQIKVYDAATDTLKCTQTLAYTGGSDSLMYFYGSTGAGIDENYTDIVTNYAVTDTQTSYIPCNVTGLTTIYLTWQTTGDDGPVGPAHIIAWDDFIESLTVYGSGGTVPESYTVDSYSVKDMSSLVEFDAVITSDLTGEPVTSGITSSCTVYGGDGVLYPQAALAYSGGKWYSFAGKAWTPRNTYSYTCTIDGVDFTVTTETPNSLDVITKSYVPGMASTVYADWTETSTGDTIDNGAAHTIVTAMGGGANTWTYSSATGLWSTTFTPSSTTDMTVAYSTTHFGMANTSGTFTLTAGGAVNGTVKSACTGLPIDSATALVARGALYSTVATDVSGFFTLPISSTDSSHLTISATGYDYETVSHGYPASGTVTALGEIYLACQETFACEFNVTESSPSLGVGAEAALQGATVKVKCGQNEYETVTDADGYGSTGTEATGTSCSYSVWKSQHKPETGTCTAGSVTRVSLAPVFANYEVEATIDGEKYTASYGSPIVSIPSGKPLKDLTVRTRSYLGAIIPTDEWITSIYPTITTTCQWLPSVPTTFAYVDNDNHAHISADGSMSLTLVCDAGETVSVKADNESSFTFDFTAEDKKMKLYNARAWTNGSDSVAYVDVWDYQTPEYIIDATCTINGTAAAYDGYTYASTITGTSPVSLNVTCSKTGFETISENMLFYPALATMHRAYCFVPKHEPNTVGTITCESSIISENATYDGYDLTGKGLEIITDASLRAKTIRRVSNSSTVHTFSGTLDSARPAGMYDDVARVNIRMSWLGTPDDSITFPHVIGYTQKSLTGVTTNAPSSIKTGEKYYCSVNVEWPDKLVGVSFEFDTGNETHSVFGNFGNQDVSSADANYGITTANVVQTRDVTMPELTGWPSGDTIIYGYAASKHRVTFIRNGFETAKTWGLTNGSQFDCRAKLYYDTETGRQSDYSPYAITSYNPTDFIGGLLGFFTDLTDLSNPGRVVLLLTIIAIPLVVMLVFFMSRGPSRPHNGGRKK